jgi:hypothetical protein
MNTAFVPECRLPGTWRASPEDTSPFRGIQKGNPLLVRKIVYRIEQGCLGFLVHLRAERGGRRGFPLGIPPGHTTSGQFVPYWFRNGDKIEIEFATEDEEGAVGDFYTVPVQTRSEHLTDPYEFELTTGENIWAISYCVPVIVDGELVGVAGVDYDLASVRVYADEHGEDSAYSFIIANSGVFVAHPKEELVGKSFAETLPELEKNYGITEKIKAGQEVRYRDSAAATGKLSFLVYEPVAVGTANALELRAGRGPEPASGSGKEGDALPDGHRPLRRRRFGGRALHLGLRGPPALGLPGTGDGRHRER